MGLIQAINIQVEGKVQGVLFRASTAKKANALGLSGWVKNLSNGRVEIHAQGPEVNLQTLLIWCNKGPVLAKVAKVYHEMAELDQKLSSFKVIR